MATLMTAKVLLTGLALLYGAGMVALPGLIRPCAFFGSPVSEAYWRSKEARARLRDFRLLTALCTVIVLIGVWMLDNDGGGLLVIIMGLFGLVGSLGAYVQATRRHQTAAARQPVVASLQPRSPWRYMRPGLEMASLAVAATSIVQVWGLVHSEAGSVTPEELWAARMLTVLAVEVFLLGGLMLIAIAWSRTALPAGATKRYLDLRERAARLTADLVYSVRLWLLATLALLVPVCVWVPIEHRNMMAVGAVLWGTLTYCPWLFYYRPRASRLRTEMAQIARPESLEPPADDRGWILGVLYFNPQNPALWVEKRPGIFYALNLARFESWIVVTAVLLPVCYLIATVP